MLSPEKKLRVSWGFWLLVLAAAFVSPLLIVLSLLLAAALHECGHLLALRLFRVGIEQLRLSARGASLHAAGVRRLSYGRELAVTLAGPAMNLLCGTLAALCALRFAWEDGFVLAGAHIILCAFNLLPIPILDGGQILLNVAETIKGSAFSTQTRERILKGGLLIIGLLFVTVMFNDISRNMQNIVRLLGRLFGRSA